MGNLLTNPPRLPLIAPSILSADFYRLGEDCKHVLTPAGDGGGGADLLHLDVMDGHFVPNLTMGPALCKNLRAGLPAAFLDVHLMVTDPAAFVEPFAEAGADHITFHIEVVPPAKIRDLARRVRGMGLTAGLAINPPTPVEPSLDLIPEFDMILIMSVNPGFSGQKFIADVLTKTRRVRSVLRRDQRLEMDGGIGEANSSQVRDAGCDVMVAATAVFGVPQSDRGRVIGALRGSK